MICAVPGPFFRHFNTIDEAPCSLDVRCEQAFWVGGLWEHELGQEFLRKKLDLEFSHVRPLCFST